MVNRCAPGAVDDDIIGDGHLAAYCTLPLALPSLSHCSITLQIFSLLTNLDPNKFSQKNVYLDKISASSKTADLNISQPQFSIYCGICYSLTCLLL
jgi:hypothetical protein